MCAKNYENPTTLSKVTAENVRDVFLRHTVVQHTMVSRNLYRATYYGQCV